jgi:hypothetical protein
MRLLWALTGGSLVPKIELEGLTVSLLDEVAIEDLSFHGNKASATLGTRDGPLCAPILEVLVTGPDSVQIKGQSVLIDWQGIKIGENEVQVVRNGRPSVYRITGVRQAKLKGQRP